MKNLKFIFVCLLLLSGCAKKAVDENLEVAGRIGKGIVLTPIIIAGVIVILPLGLLLSWQSSHDHDSNSYTPASPPSPKDKRAEEIRKCEEEIPNKYFESKGTAWNELKAENEKICNALVSSNDERLVRVVKNKSNPVMTYLECMKSRGTFPEVPKEFFNKYKSECQKLKDKPLSNNPIK